MEYSLFMEQLNRYYDVWQKCNSVYEDWAKEHGLSMNGLLVLIALQEGGEACTQGRISQRWGIPKQTTNMILKDLEHRGLAMLLPMKEDKRNKQICFTAEGRDYADGIISKLRRVELSVLEKMGIERIKQLNDGMAIFAELFDKEKKEEDHEANV